MKKIMVFYASYGGGHFSAAKSIKSFLDENYKDLEVELVDCMKYVNKIFNKVSTRAYTEMARKAPKLWGKVYYRSKKGFIAGLSKGSNKLMSFKLLKLINEFNPDIIVSTHPFGSQMVSHLKRKGKTNCKLATILTDFEFHEQWLVGHKHTELFFVSNDDMKSTLVNNGVDQNKIHVTGIPFSNRFLENFNKLEIFKMFDLDPNKKVILFFGGGEYGFGKEKTIHFLRSLILSARDYQIIAIAGKNEKMKLAFEEVVEQIQCTNRVKVLPFTDKVPELMHISSVVVSKPGGLTTTESLVSGLPMIIINPLPGQEEENALFLEKYNVGIRIRSYDSPEVKLTEIFNNPTRIENMRESTKTLAKPNSTKEICDCIVNL